jgi:hypothetical protein
MGAGTSEEPEDARALYRLPPEQFTAARDALARRLRSSGDREKAEEIRRLRRPNAVAWSLNQVAQEHPGLIDEALATGSELREAMEIGDGRLLRDAERATREATDAVVDQAERLLAEAGHAPTDDIRSRLAATLRAAIVDPEVASILQAGTLERDVELPGFGMEAPVVPAPKSIRARATARPRAKAADDEQERQEQDAKEERRRREEERRAKEDERRAVKRRLAELESEATRVARQAQRLAATADRAEEEARQARAEADAAVAAADEIAAKVAEAREQLRGLGAE